MKKILLIATLSLLTVSTTTYAATVTVDGTFSLTYTPTISSASSDMSFSSAPGDDNNDTPDLNTQNPAAGHSVSNNPFTLSAPVGSSTTTTDFFTADPTTYSHNVCTVCGPTNTATGTIQASFTFSEPSGATGTLIATGTYTADYNNTTDSIVWNTGDPLTVDFTDGDVLTVTLNNASDWNITSTMTYSMKQPTTVTGTSTSVPEPASLAILGSAVAGIGALRRRRNYRMAA
jgi:hypothetical protein